MAQKKFLRRNTSRHSRLGRGRKKKQIWRKPKGRDNKMREKKRGYPKTVSIGYKKNISEKIVEIRNINDLNKVKEGDKIKMGSIGAKKKYEIIKKAQEKRMTDRIINVNTKKFITKMELKKKHHKSGAKSNVKPGDEKK